MKNISKSLITIPILLLLIACAQQDPSDISVRLPIPYIEAAFTPYYAAIDQGYYAEEGLNVTFETGTSETNPVRMVASGADEFGFLGGPDTLLVARSKGQPLVAIAILHKGSDFPVIVSLEESGIDTLQELNNTRIGFFYGHISTDVLRSLLNTHHIDYEEVDVGPDYSQLIAGKLEAQWAWRTTAGINLPASGHPINIISPQEYGMTTHGFTFFTTEEMIQSNPEIVEKFLRATLRGVEYTQENPDKALESVLTRNPALDPELERYRLDAYMERVTLPLGYLDHEMFEETYERLVASGVITQEFDVEDAYTTRFFEAIA